MEKSIENLENDVYVCDLKQAIKCVKKIYYRWNLVKNASEKEKEAAISYCERVYSYELYHQFRKIMESYQNKNKYEDLYLSGEPIKNNKFFSDLFEEIVRAYGDTQNTFVPDLVLHKDLGSTEEEGQIFLAEIKMAENRNALDDLSKLTKLQKSKLNFERYIFIYAGKNMQTLKEEIKKRYSKNINEISDNIICICYEFPMQEIEVELFKDIKC